MASKPASWGLAALATVLLLAGLRPASAEFFGCEDQHHAVRAAVYRTTARHAFARAHVARTTRETREFSAQSRPRITVHPRRTTPGPNAKRYCRSWLAKEYRVSGPVIVPQMQCWWQ